MVPNRRSLRFRILSFFVLAGAILGPLLGIALLFLTLEIQEWTIERSLQAQLAAVVEAPADYALRRPTTVADLRVLASVPVDELPVSLLRVPDGIHEHETRTSAWLIGMATTPAGRLAVVEDISIMESREHYGFLIAGLGALAATYGALVLGFYFSRRLIAPVLRLSNRVSQLERQGTHQPIAAEFDDDEIGNLAAALDRYHARTQDALRREREFSADAGHELRNPLTVIHNAAELIEDDESVPERSRRAVRRIADSARSMRDTVDALLLMVREHSSADAGESIAITGVVDAVLEREEDGTGDGPPVHRRYLARPQIQAPRTAIEITIANLVRNALQHSGASAITITLASDRLTVADDGVGVPAEDLAELKERGRRGTHAGGHGTGLGLAIVQRLCQRFGWALTIDSALWAGTRAEWRFLPGRAESPDSI